MLFTQLSSGNGDISPSLGLRYPSIRQEEMASAGAVASMAMTGGASRSRRWVASPGANDGALSSGRKCPLLRRSDFGGGELSGELESRVTRGKSVTVCSLKDLRDRIQTVKNTQKITEAMKLVAAAKVRRAQEAVVNGRPFSEALVQVLYNVNERLQLEDVDTPLTKVRPVKKVALVVITGDRGLCGGFNNTVLKKAEERMRQLKETVELTVVSIGKKGNSYFTRRPYINLDKTYETGTAPRASDAQAIADELFALFVSEEVDKVELLYTKFVSLIKSEPVIHTLLPLSPQGQVCDINGNCVDAAEDEMFRLTTREGKLTVERETFTTPVKMFPGVMIFEQEPVQILDALLPLYLNSQLLRALQESVASELAARMNAMNTASDNANDLKRDLSIRYNRQRQAKITGEILEIVSGANAVI